MHMHIAHADWVQINSEESLFFCAAKGDLRKDSLTDTLYYDNQNNS